MVKRGDFCKSRTGCAGCCSSALETLEAAGLLVALHNRLSDETESRELREAARGGECQERREERKREGVEGEGEDNGIFER
jgi:hypothetical protein